MPPHAQALRDARGKPLLHLRLPIVEPTAGKSLNPAAPDIDRKLAHALGEVLYQEPGEGTPLPMEIQDALTQIQLGPPGLAGWSAPDLNEDQQGRDHRQAAHEHWVPPPHCAKSWKYP